MKKITQALELGFTSVMFDGSHLPLDENIEMTKKVMAMAEDYDAAVEAEIGCVGGSEDGSEDIAINCTKPEDAVRFEKETGVDALAIAIGNAHGNYKSTPKLRFDILQKVDELTDTPLVLHGGTGISPDDFVKCSKTGIKKINIATATFDMVENTVHNCYNESSINGYYDLQAAEVEGAYQNAKKHILIFGSDGKC
ncbi:MAG: class II fructose-bisphosphate aldolase [Eubacterium sp.]